ncbi:MAG: ParB N-terminal domain-containing protein [Oscillospiraceae bacterium]|nr:ParB N-terminal domain-containing protein [Oscillospiraceae bacterium]
MSIQVVDKIEMKSISEIKPYFRNPRRNDKTVDMLVDLIPRVGFNVPILIDDDSVIVKGHARYRAAIRLGLGRVPCVVTHADEEAKKLDRLADNKVSELSERVTDDLLHELDMLNIDFDISRLGFPAIDIEGTLADFDLDSFTDDVESESEEDQEARRARFQQMLDGQSQEIPSELITSQDSITKAMQKQQSVPEKPKRYYRLCCEKCGHVMYVAEGDAHFISEDLPAKT